MYAIWSLYHMCCPTMVNGLAISGIFQISERKTKISFLLLIALPVVKMFVEFSIFILSWSGLNSTPSNRGTWPTLCVIGPD